MEEVLLVRDEMANMVWGVEIVVPTADGASNGQRRPQPRRSPSTHASSAARPGGTTASEPSRSPPSATR